MRVKSAQRLVWLSALLPLLFGYLGFRVYELQIPHSYRGHDLTREVHLQQSQFLPLQMKRGLILDRNGQPLTAPESSYAVGLFPKAIPSLDSLELGRLFTPMEAYLIRRAAAEGPEPRWVIEQGLSQSRADAIRTAGLPGIVVGSTGHRYGSDSLARHLVGFANDLGGQMGLEKAFEQELFGDQVPGFMAIFDGRDRLMGSVDLKKATSGKPPYDLFTTIDSRIQAVVEWELDRTEHPLGGPLRGAVVVLDVTSGEPLAIASRPNFDQTAVPRESHVQWNRAFTAYEPGSVFKPLVAAAALEEGKLRLDEVLDCPAQRTVGGMNFYNVDRKGYGKIPFREAMARSCNTSMIEIGYERLGAEKLLETARQFGLGRPTGIYPGAEEQEGLLPRLLYGGDVAQFSFGQGGLMTTPLQIARAYAAIASGGILPPVRLVTAVRTPDGEVVERPQAEKPRRVMEQETAWALQEALRAVTDPAGVGTGRLAWVERGGSAGKTGSAETVQNGQKITHAWFAGWVPVRSPRYVIVVFLENGQSGGAYAAPLFRRIAEEL